MSETSGLRLGQKATLTGTVIGVQGRAIELEVRESGENYVGWNHIVVDASALTPVVEPEPQWSPGDVVRIDGVTYVLFCTGIGQRWIPSVRGEPRLAFDAFSQAWSEGRVVVVYRKEADK